MVAPGMMAPVTSATVPVTSALPLNGPRSCSIFRSSEPPLCPGWLTTLPERASM